MLKLVEPETAGDPQNERKWLRVSVRQLADRLDPTGHGVSEPAIARLLRKHDYSRRLNAQEKEPGAQHPDRNQQFEHLEAQITRFRAASQPIISAETKKKELIGEFKQAGKTSAIKVNAHDFPSQEGVRRLMASMICNATKARSMPANLLTRPRCCGDHTMVA